MIRLLKRAVAKAKRIRREKRDVATISESGLFDESYYLAKYEDVKDSGIDAVLHFVRSGYLEGRDPSARFRTAFYARTNPDVATSGTNPLLHYILYGLAEGRAPLPSRPAPRPPSYPGRHAFEPSRIALLAHIHYPELTDELLSTSTFLPRGAKILVYATNEESAAAAREWAVAHGKEIMVQAGPNRGRNVASYTCAFGRYLLDNIDVFCHLHSKKSLYTGTEKKSWRQHNIKALIGNKEDCEAALDAISDPDMGLLAPQPFYTIPYYAFSWLSNESQIEPLEKKLGVRLPHEGYLDYPLGNMFWARPKALWQLLDGRIVPGDFPEEAGQTDGTLAHAIERILAVVAKRNGYSWAEFGGKGKLEPRETSDRNLWQYYKATRQGLLLYMLKGFETVSFSLWDTLVQSRLLTPDLMFELMENELSHSDPFYANFKVRRLAAGTSVSPKANLVELYQRMGAKDAECKANKEEEMLLRFVEPRESVIGPLNHAKAMDKRVILVEDRLQSKQSVEQIMLACGIQSVDEMYLGSELGAIRADGSLWDAVAAQEKCDETFLHIGSDEQGDIQIPTKRGLTTFHVMSAANLWSSSLFGLAPKNQTEPFEADWLAHLSAARIFNDPFCDRSGWSD